jgi:hypothetical protein
MAKIMMADHVYVTAGVSGLSNFSHEGIVAFTLWTNSIS